MQRADVELQVREIVGTVLRKEVDANHLRSSDPSWDSLNHVEIIFSVEDSFDVRFDRGILDSLNGIQQITESVWLYVAT